MLTTCPECHTSFRLSHAQLEARRGLVRCGYCRAVFNAYDTLLPEFDTPATAAEPEAPLTEPAALEGDRAPAADELPDEAFFGETVTPAEPAPVADEAESALEDEPDDDAFVLHLSEQVGQEMPQFGPPPVMPFTQATPLADDPDAILLSELPTRNQIEPGPGISRRILFAFLSLFLILALFAQAAYFLRGPLVLWMPEIRAGLETACQRLGCSIPLASELTSIRIESSSLETDPEQANRATLRVSFSNRSDSVQQWPHFMLRLTDWKGAPLAQRAFRPADYLPKDKVNGVGIVPMSEQEFHLDLDLGGLSASGYEVFPKYP